MHHEKKIYYFITNLQPVTKPKHSNGLYSLSYSEFVVPLVKAVQEQQQNLEVLKKQLEELRSLVVK